MFSERFILQTSYCLTSWFKPMMTDKVEWAIAQAVQALEDDNAPRWSKAVLMDMKESTIVQSWVREVKAVSIP